MKKLYFFLAACLFSLAPGFAQQDCCDAEPLFSNLPVTVSGNSGNGTFEDLSACSCLATDEHDAYWFAFECVTGGTFEMMITPAGLSADFDFALYGAACPCDAATVVVECDYTGPIVPPGPFVPTGIATDPMATFGVPGLTEFQPTVMLQAGTVYYIIADNITTNGAGFTIEFAGSAVIGPPPFNPPPPPPAPLFGSLTACPGAVLGYSVPGGAPFTSFNWTVSPPTATISGNGSNSVDVEWTLPGSYTLCVEGDAGCETSPQNCITVTVTPIVAQPIADVICIGGFYNAPDGQVFSNPGVYTLQFDSWQGCDSNVLLTLTPVPFSVTILVEEICEGDCVVFGGQTLCESGIYNQLLTNQYGCDSTVTLNLIAVPNQAVITGGGAISCTGGSVVLDGSGSLGGSNMNYLWTNQSGATVGNQPTLTVTTPGTYTLTTTSTVGNHICTDQAQATVAANNTPPANVTATGGVISCSASSVALAGNSSSPGVTYAWTGPGGYSSNLQNPTVSVTGTYVLTVTGTNGCTATASASVTGDSNLPNASATGGTIDCDTPNLTLSGSSTTSGVTWAWTGPGSFSSNQQNPSASAPGTYTLTVTAPNGCSAQATALVLQNSTLPNASATGGALDCASPSLTLQGGSTTPGVAFGWTGPGGFSSNQQNPSVSAPGTYVLTVTGTNGCTASASAVVSQDASAPNASATGGALDCDATSLDLQGSSTTPGALFDWTGPGGFTSDLQNPTVSVPGTYVLTVTATNGCTASASAVVSQNTAAPDASASGGTLTCTSGSIALSGDSTTPGVSFGWTGPGGFTSNQQNPTVSQSGTYILTVTAANGCTATASALVMQDAGVPDVFASAGDTLDCSTSSVTLDGGSATSGVTLAWTGPGGFTSTSLNPVVTAPGAYILTATAPNNCMAQALATVILDDQAPDVQAVGGMLTCLETSVTLDGESAAAGATFAWTGPGGFTSTSPDPTVSVFGNYTLTVTGANGCTASETAVVDENTAAPDVQATAGALDCDTPDAPLDGGSATAGATFEWTGPGGFAASVSDTIASMPGNYVLTVTATNGCTASASAVVLQDAALPDVQATGGILSCGSASIVLAGSSSTPGVTWAWTGPGGFTSSQQNPSVAQAGSYLLTVTAPNGCTASDGATVAQDANAPNVSATGGTLTCDETSVQLSGNSTTSGVTWAWTGPGGFSSNQQNPTVSTSGTYTLTVTAANGCSSTASAVVAQNTTPPNATASGGAVTCTSGTLTLQGGSTTPGATFSWTGPGGFTSTEQNPTVSTAGAYILTVTGTNGCTASATASVTADANVPNITATGGELNCDVLGVILNGGSTTPNVTFLWTGPGGFSSTNSDPSVSTPGTYTLTVSAPNGCTASATAFVISNTTPPDASAAGGQITCTNPSVTLSGNSTTPGVTWVWTGPGGFFSSQQNPAVTQGGTYLLTVTAPNGCEATASAEVLLDPGVPTAGAGGGTLTCLVTAVQLEGSSNQPDVSWSWTGPGGFTSSEQNPTVSSPGFYTLTVTTVSGCSSTAEAIVSEDATPPSAVIAPPAQLDCVTESVTLDATGSDAGTDFIFQWLTIGGNFVSGENSLTPEVDAAGTYILEVLNQNNGCAATATVVVLLSDAAPNGAALAVTDPSCFGQNDGSIVVGAVQGGTPPYLYALDNQAFGENSTFANLPPGDYLLTVSDATGCTWQTPVTLASPPQFSVSLAAVDLEAELLPLGESVELEATTSLPSDLLASVAWTPAEAAAGCGNCLTISVQPFGTTTYTVTVADSNGCAATAEVTIPVSPVRPVFVPNAFSPNGDGINDLLTLFGGASVVKIKSFLVLSRWGETIWEYHNFLPNDPAFGWDGFHRGRLLDVGVYTWFAEVEFIDGETIVFEGDVTLVR